MAETTLASYELDGEPHRITAQELTEHFNRRIVRRKPRTAADVVAGLQDILVEEYDHRTARRLQLDRTPKFVEDRRNFALNQALAAYEQEMLLPGLHPTQEELQKYAAMHRDAYLSPVECSGTLYVFADHPQAAQAAVQLQQVDTVSAAVDAVQTIDRFIVRRDGAQLISSWPNGAVIAAPDGALFGPFAYAERAAVFVKRTSGNRVALPFPAIEPQVRSEFLRAKLDEAELALFRKNVAAASLQVHLDPAKYGLPASFVFGAPGSQPSTPDFRSDRASLPLGARSAGSDQTTTITKPQTLVP